MKIMARRKLLYGVLYSAGDVFECGDVEQVRAWVATGAVGLMGAALPERVETQARGDMATALDSSSEAASPEAEPEVPSTEQAQEESMPPAESPDESPVNADAASAETKSTRRRGK